LEISFKKLYVFIRKIEVYSVTYVSHQKSCTTFSINKYSCKVFRKQRCTKPTKAPN